MTVAERLTEMGIELPDVAPPLAVYRPASRSGNLVFVSGQLPTRDGQVVNPGRLGDGVTIEQGYEAARVCAVNALAAAKSLLGTLEGTRLVRTVGYVAGTPEFTSQPAVVNGASELLRDIFGEDRGIGARLALGVTSLPLGAAVEVEIWLEVSA
ncbi:MAG: RidA family protein [Dehalococcoidia bacterium]|nr:RidA family protein [Dehalococcoidia bacterium]